MMRTSGTMMLLAMVGVLAGTGGCKSPEEVALEAERDVAETQRRAGRDVVKAQRRAQEELNDARKTAAQDVQEVKEEAAQDLNEVQGEAADDMADARREGAQDVAEAQREAAQQVAGAREDAMERRQQVGEAVERAGTGTIRGRVFLTGAAPPSVPLARVAGCDGMPVSDDGTIVNSDHTLRNALVRLTRGVSGTFAVPSRTLQIGEDHCMYRPRVSAIVAGQTIEVERSGANVVVPTIRATGPFTCAQLGASPVECQTSRTGGLLTLRDPLRPWMRAYVMVLNHDHFAVTDDHGAFTIANVAPGTYGIESWQEHLGRKATDVTVRADQTTTQDFSYSGIESGGFATAVPTHR